MKNIPTLSADILEMTLPNLPCLDSLHIIHCAKVDQSIVLRLFAYIPQVQSLALTCYVMYLPVSLKDVYADGNPRTRNLRARFLPSSPPSPVYGI